MTSAALEAFYEALQDDDAEDLYERAPCGFLSTTPNGTIIKINQTLLAWLGRTRDELLGKRFTDLLTPGGRIYHETHYAPMLSMQGSAREIALELIASNGHRLPTLVNSVLVKDPAGEPALIRTAIFDATERRSYENELLLAKQRAESAEAEAKVLAHTLQRTLIPPDTPEIPGLELAAHYRPSGSGSEVGGDFYDIFQIAEGDWALVLGDVCGKGVEAAVVTALARYTMRGVAVQEPTASGSLRILNELLLREGVERFVTVVTARLRRGEGVWHMQVSAGGHPLPLLLRPGQEPRRVGHHGSLLGMFDDPSVRDAEIELRSGDSVVFFTDGVTEGRRDREFYGEKRLHDILGEGGPAKVVADRLLDDVMEFESDFTSDDIAIVVLHVP